MKQTLEKLDKLTVYFLKCIFMDKFNGLESFGFAFVFSGLFNAPEKYIYIGMFLWVWGNFAKLSADKVKEPNALS